MRRPVMRLVTLLLVLLAGVAVVIGAAIASPLFTGMFLDDDGSVHEANIEAIALEGITIGCNPPANDRFCPGEFVTRGQVAAFMRRALHLQSSSVDAFIDDDQSIFEDDIDAVASAGITMGCNPPENDRFCPGRSVTREEMAAFLHRAFAYPSADRDHFRDDDDSIFEADIDALAMAGVTRGCNPPANDRYCPTAPVKRDQMASFLARSLGLSLPARPMTITLAGDMGANVNAFATLSALAAISPDAHFVVGDISYSQVVPESAWCSYVHSVIGWSLPMQLLVGNHEDDNGSDGFIREFTACMPDMLDSVGDYGVQYYSDFGDLIRVILISPDITVDGIAYNYTPGSSERNWLEARVAEAKKRGSWIVLAHHKVCISSAEKICEITQELANWEAANVDVVVMGHAHNYQRSHQLSCVDVNTVRESCVVDVDGSHARGEGAVFVIAGIGGRHRPINRADTEAGYFAALMGEGDTDWGHGFVRIDISDSSLVATFVGGDTTYSDTFSITR